MIDLTVLHGDPTAAELAALVLVLTALSHDAAAAPGRREGGARPPWASYSRGLRRTPTPGPGAWRASGRP